MSTLLIVDDEPAVRAITARLARAAGYTVSVAGCAGEALDQMAAGASSVVLCDVNMPDRSGLWLAAQELEAGLEEGAMAALAKPFTRAQLLGTLDRARDWHLERTVASN
jgi:DNA-binding response OmpR family regulator